MVLNKRLEVRLKEEEKEMLNKASKKLNMSRSRFVVMSALEKAEEILKNENKEIDK